MDHQRVCVMPNIQKKSFLTSLAFREIQTKIKMTRSYIPTKIKKGTPPNTAKAWRNLVSRYIAGGNMPWYLHSGR